MTVSDDRDTPIAALLANHTIRLSYKTQIVSCWGCDWDADYGLGVASDVLHRNHLAAVLAAYITDREAEAWDAGLDWGYGGGDPSSEHNPFRFTPDTEGETGPISES